jgi:flagellar biosynthesis protein FliR
MILYEPMLTNYFFITVRISTILLVTPIQAIRQLPIHARILLIATMGVILTYYVPEGQHKDQITLILCAIIECANGLILASCIMLSFAAFNMAGELIDNTIGLNAMSVFNPVAHQHEAISSHLLMMLSVLFFFGIDGHLWLFKGLVYSFTVIPPGQPTLFTHTIPVIKAYGFMCATALMISCPIMLTLLILDCSAAFVARSMPQVSPYFLIIPLKIMLGLFLLMLMQKNLNPIMHFVLNTLFNTWQEVMS